MASGVKRVKLYSLDSAHQWMDMGTGVITTNFAEERPLCLKVVSENGGSSLLDNLLISKTRFERQQERLILWCDENDHEYALSFQEKEACEAVWNIICRVHDEKSEFAKDLNKQVDDASSNSSPLNLPHVSCNNLESIYQIMKKIETPEQTKKLAYLFLRRNYVSELLECFHSCEAENNFEGLEYLCEIFKHIVSLGNYLIFKEMFAEDKIFDVVGCFEYDKCVKSPKHHREFLKHGVQYKEILPGLHPDLLQTIHQTYRVQYLQDLVLPSVNALDESIFLSQFLDLNKISIVNRFQEEEVFLTNIIELLADKTTEIIKRKNMLLFLKELFSYAQHLITISKESFYSSIIAINIIPSMEVSLQVDSQEIKLLVLEVFSFVVEHSPCEVRKYMLSQTGYSSEKLSLLMLLVDGIIYNACCENSNSAFLSFLKLLLNPDNMESSPIKSDKTDFLNYFYENGMDAILEPVLNISHDTTRSLADILEFLEFCVGNHSYHIRNIVLSKDLLRFVLQLLTFQCKVLALCAIRFVRKIITLKDEFYNKYIIQSDLFQPIVEAFLKNEGRYNMLDSAILEIFEFISSERLKSLSTYIMEVYGAIFEDVNYVQTFKCLRHYYEQNCLQNKETPMPIYVENGFKDDYDWRYKLDLTIAENDTNIVRNKGLIDGGEEIKHLESSDDSNCTSPVTCTLTVDRTPIFRRVGCIIRRNLSNNSVSRRICRKRLLDYEFDDSNDDDDEDNDDDNCEEIIKSKKMRITL